MKVFISYRRDDSAGHAGRVHDRLTREFGHDLMFMDVDAIPLGVNFIKVLREQVASCDVLLALIGPNWLNAHDDDGNPRLNNPNDFVRIEIATALHRDIPVIPILLEGARIPKAGQLPDDLKELAERNALDVRHASFHSDMDRLIRSLQSRSEEVDGRPLPTEDTGDRQRSQLQARQIGDLEAPQRIESEARHRADAEARQKAEIEARLLAEAEARQKVEAEARQKVEAEARQRADAEARLKAEEDARRRGSDKPPTRLRQILIGGGTFAALVAAGLIVWAVYKPAPAPEPSPGPKPAPAPSPTPPAIRPTPPPVAGPACSTGKVLLDEDFSAADPAWGPQNNNFSIKDGSAVIKLDPQQQIYEALNRAFLFGDADICLTVTALTVANPKSTTSLGGLAFWAKDYSNFYALKLTTNGYFRIGRLLNGAWVHAPLDWRESDALLQGLNQPNQLRLTIQGQTLSIAINGKPASKLIAQSPGGQSFLGLYAEATDTGDAWKFNAMKVTGLK